MSSLPVTDQKYRATKLAPKDWKAMLDKVNSNVSINQQLPTIIDLRNDYEWDAGHF